MKLFAKAVFNLSQGLLRTGLKLWDIYKFLEPETAAAVEPLQEEPVRTEPDPFSTLEDDLKQIPDALVEMEPLPEPKVFRAMFERKFGTYGQCPLTIAGRSRVYTCNELYDLLSKIREFEKPDPLLVAVYGAVMTVILRAHGEGEANQKSLN